MLSTLLHAASYLKKPVQDVATESIKDAYAALKSHLRKKFGEQSEAAKALESATEKPESAGRKAVLGEETAAMDLEHDSDLVRLCEQLIAVLPQAPVTVHQTANVRGRGHKVQMAGRDLNIAEKHVTRNAITPDERHISTAEKKEALHGDPRVGVSTRGRRWKTELRGRA